MKERKSDPFISTLPPVTPKKPSFGFTIYTTSCCLVYTIHMQHKSDLESHLEKMRAHTWVCMFMTVSGCVSHKNAKRGIRSCITLRPCSFPKWQLGSRTQSFRVAFTQFWAVCSQSGPFCAQCYMQSSPEARREYGRTRNTITPAVSESIELFSFPRDTQRTQHTHF